MTTRNKHNRAAALSSAVLMTLVAAPFARAADMPAVAPPAIAPVPGSFNFFSGIEFHVQGEAGILGNAYNPSQGLDGKGFNFGQLYTDHANTPELNQILLTITKPVDPKATGYAFGFTLQGLYGSDMRFNHFLGIGSFFGANDRNQLNVTQAFVAGHLPIFTKGGVDVKVGLFTSPQGFETLDPSTTPFYSHSYIYNYGVTFNHTGVITTTHINDTLDFYLGVDTGNQTTFGSTFPGNRFGDFGDPNGQPAGFVGFGLNNLLNNKLTVLALSHIGPEQSPNSDPFGYKDDLRYYNAVDLTYKINDNLTSVTELDYTRDDFGIGNGPAELFGVSQYFSYTFNKIFTFNARGEVLRDTQNFFVATPLVNSGNALAEEGFAGPTLAGPTGSGTTYGEVTLGLTIKPDVPKPLALVALRPEIRYDRVIAGAPLYGSSTYTGNFNGSRNQFTFGGDIIIGF